jgi:hypothetical protein
MEERQAAEDDVAGLDLAGGAGGDVGVAVQVAVRQLGALRLAGGAGGVEDHRGVVLLRVGQAGRGLVLAEHRRERLRLDLEQLGAGVGGAVARLGGEAVPGEQDPGSGVLEVEGDLAPLQQHVHRHDDAAGAQHPVVGDGELEHVGQHHADPLARAQSPGQQQGGEPGAAVVELGIGEDALAEPDGRAVGHPCGALGDDRCQVQTHRFSSRRFPGRV